MQLEIYLLLATNTQTRPVNKLSYWYLESDKNPKEIKLPDMNTAYDEVLTIAKKVKLARKLNKLTCPNDGCNYCKPFEAIIEGKARLVGRNDFGQDVYVVGEIEDSLESDIL